MPILRADDDGQLSYRIHGTGYDAVLLVHGWMVSGQVWDPLAEELTGRRLVCPDLRGSGRSTPARRDLRLERLARDVLAVAEHAGLERFALVGHSMGGQVALLAAALVPDRITSLALLNPVPPGGLALPEPVVEAFRGAGGNADALGSILDASCRDLPSHRRATLVADALTIEPDWIAEGFDIWRVGGVEAAASQVRAPTLVVATDDPFLSRELLDVAVRAKISRAELTVIPEAGHYPQLERAAATGAVLEAFWKRVG